MAQTKDLLEFLTEAELQHYYNSFKNDLKVASVPQLKYVEEDDLADLGMTKPEMRRLKKFFKKECPQGTFGKLKKILTVKGGESVSPSGSPLVEKSLPHTRPSRHIISEDSITIIKLLGTGEFGTVQQGLWTNEEGDRVQVAIKCLSKERMQSGTADFLKEATIMHTIDHPSIVRLYGVVLGSTSLMLVSELAPLRSLLECIKEPSLRHSFPVASLCGFACQIASGMTYLEAKRLIHRDLAARNILVFSKDKVKISDFGLSRALGVGQDYYQTNFNVNLKLPIAWCSPECINYLKFTSASDAWAFGVTLWEMFSYGFQPWAAFTGQQNGSESEPDDWTIQQKILEAIDEPNHQRLEQPEHCTREYYAIMMKCWEHEPERRPKFAELEIMLPQLKPEKFQALHDCTAEAEQKDLLMYKATDIITVLDKKPEHAPSPMYYKGCLENGKAGYFDPLQTAPYIDIQSSPALRQAKTKMSRKVSRSIPSLYSDKDSQRKSIKGRKFHAGMIGAPQNDLRHTGHIGYDGAVFGDVSFIGDQYDKLPVKVVTPYRPENDLMSASVSLPVTEKKIRGIQGSQSEVSLTSGTESVFTGFSSGSDKDTLTDVSSMMDEVDSLPKSTSEEKTLDKYEELDDFDLDFGDFKLPDMGTTLDLGPSFMDEVMKALSETRDDKTETSLLDDTSPLLEKSQTFTNGNASFTNVAMTSESDTMDTDTETAGSGSLNSIDPESVGSIASGGSGGADGSPYAGAKGSPTYRRKPKLKLDSDEDDEGYLNEWMIPSRDSWGKKEGLKPLSASDERKINEAIELANEFAQIRTSDHMVSSPQSGHAEHAGESDHSGTESPKARTSVFGLGKKRSPKPERKSFSEEIASLSSDLNEEVTPEAQEAYNMLVVKGPPKGKETKVSRDRRMRRSIEHQGSSPEPPAIERSYRNGRNVNANIREPQGIPRPGVNKQPGGEEAVDVNPLRRLRDSQSFIPKPRFSRPLDTQENGHTNGTSPESANLNPNLQFFAKLKEQEQERESEVSDNGDVKHPPLPPRAPLRPGTINQPPRQRKHPLTLSNYKDHMTEPLGTTSNGMEEMASYDVPPTHTQSHFPMAEHSSESAKPGSSIPNGTAQHTSNSPTQPASAESDDSVFTESDSSSPPLPQKTSKFQQKPKFSFPLMTSSTGRSKGSEGTSVTTSLSVKSVKLSAVELGINDNRDTFWSEDVNFLELAGAGSESPTSDLGAEDQAPIPGRYKTSDNVSYEDLMEFALDSLDGAPPRGTEELICDEVRLMRKVLTNDVTVEDCMYALEETKWDVHSAIKLLKLKQLLSTNLSNKEQCKRALLRSQWDVQEAANHLLANPPGSESPEVIHI